MDDSDWKNIQFIPNRMGDALLVQATGGDGGAAYMVSLVFRKDGKHQQFLHDSWGDGLPKKEEVWKLVSSNQ